LYRGAVRTKGYEVGIIFRDGKVLGRSSITTKKASNHAENRHCRTKETSEEKVVCELAKYTQWEGLEVDGP